MKRHDNLIAAATAALKQVGKDLGEKQTEIAKKADSIAVTTKQVPEPEPEP